MKNLGGVRCEIGGFPDSDFKNILPFIDNCSIIN
jgi:hypothetical protein